MNERIKELITKSNGYWEHGDFNMPRTVCFDETDVEKFAELIVEECAELVESQHTWITSVAASALIRQHFGVEE